MSAMRISRRDRNGLHGEMTIVRTEVYEDVSASTYSDVHQAQTPELSISTR